MDAPAPPPDGEVAPWARDGKRGPPIDPRRLVLPRALVMALLTALLIEFVLGLATVEWTVLPSSAAKLAGGMSYGWLSAHALVGALLGLLALVLVIAVARLGRPRLLGAAILGLVFIAIAAGSGAALLDTGNGLYALLMGFGFLAAWSIYLTLAFRLRRMLGRSRWQARTALSTPPSTVAP